MITTPQGNFESDSPFQRRSTTIGMPDMRILPGGVTVIGRKESPVVGPSTKVLGEKGPVGNQGPTGPAGPTGPTGILGNQRPTGPTGPTGITGPTGPTGPRGPRGPSGPAGDVKTSYVDTPAGVFQLACVEGTRPYFFHIREASEEVPEEFLHTVAGKLFQMPSHDGKHELCLGVRREFPEWFMPKSNLKQREHSVRFWNQEHLSLDQRRTA